MKTNVFLRAFLAIAAAAIGAAANATTYEFGPLGKLLSGTFQPNGTFAELSVTKTGFNVFRFSLTSNDLNSLFTNNSFIGGIAVHTEPGVTASNVSISNFSGSGIDGVVVGNGGTPNSGGGGWEFKFNLGNGSPSQQGIHRLGANESAAWTATFNNASAVHLGGEKGFAIHVQGITGSPGGGGGAWFQGAAVSPAPELEIYVMMLAGLGLMGFVVRRRRSMLAS